MDFGYIRLDIHSLVTELTVSTKMCLGIATSLCGNIDFVVLSFYHSWDSKQINKRYLLPLQQSEITFYKRKNICGETALKKIKRNDARTGNRDLKSPRLTI